MFFLISDNLFQIGDILFQISDIYYFLLKKINLSLYLLL